jgi:hypothetical protein
MMAAVSYLISDKNGKLYGKDLFLIMGKGIG